MTPENLLKELRQKGVGLWIDNNNRLSWCANGAVVHEAHMLISQHRNALTTLVKKEPVEVRAPVKREQPAAWPPDEAFKC